MFIFINYNMHRHYFKKDYKSSTISSDYISSDEEENIDDDVFKKILEKTATIKIQIKELKNKYILDKDKFDEQLIKNSSLEQLVLYYNNIITTLTEHCQQVISLKDTADSIRRELKNRNIISHSD